MSYEGRRVKNNHCFIAVKNIFCLDSNRSKLTDVIHGKIDTAWNTCMNEYIHKLIRITAYYAVLFQIAVTNHR